MYKQRNTIRNGSLFVMEIFPLTISTGRDNANMRNRSSKKESLPDPVEAAFGAVQKLSGEARRRLQDDASYGGGA
jgi:hypothetical protein